MMYSLHASWGVLSACRQPGLSEHRISPDWEQYTTKEKGAQGPFSNISKEILSAG
jgi:hypothetical protein